MCGKSSALYDSTSPDWVPSLKMGHNKAGCINDSDRYERANSIKRRAHEVEFKNKIKLDESQVEETGTAVQTDMTNSDIVQLQQEVNRLKREIKALIEVKPKDNLSIESFKANNSLVKFYTGLPNWDVFSVVFEFVKGELLQNSSLTSFHQLLVVFLWM